MIFHSIQFIVFFLITYLIFWVIPDRYRKQWLLITSMVFYGFWSIPFLFHFMAAVVISYLFVQRLLVNRSRTTLVLAIGLNLANLFFFKYFNTLLIYLNDWFGLHQSLVLKEQLGLFLPLAISFYTFQIIAFIVDVWRGEIKEVSFLRFAVFILFFPQLIAGPIMRHRDFLFQMDHPVFSRERMIDGVGLMLLGVFKKVLIADAMSDVINPIWSNPGNYDLWTLIGALIGFTIQVYADFSGYTDMARGLASMMGYDIPENFYWPYLSTSFSNLWQNWHVTLSTWLRDYLYFPLGGSRVSPARVHFNMFVVMSLGGLWHGNTYTFFLWGVTMWFFLFIEKFLGMNRKSDRWMVNGVRWIFVYSGWIFGGLFFRSSELSQVGAYLSGLWNPGTARPSDLFLVWQLIVYGLGLQLLRKYTDRIYPLYARWRGVVVPVLSVTLFYMLVRYERHTEQFIYFQF